MKRKISKKSISLFLAVMLVVSMFLGAVQISFNNAYAASVPSAGASGYVSGDKVNLRSGPGTSYSIITCMSQNTKFTFTDGKLYNSDWYKIKLENNVSGYIIKTYAAVSETVSEPTNPPSSSGGAAQPSAMIFGDVNGDGVIDINDGTAIQRHSARYSVIDENRLLLADVNEDGVVDVLDTTCISRYSAKCSSGTGIVGKVYVDDTSITISSTAQTLYKNNYTTVSASASGKISWSSSNENVATVTDGLIYAKNTGTANITATSGSNSATCKITVVSGGTVNISSKNVTTNKGRSVYLTSSTSGVTWKTSDSSIATVKNGIVDTKESGTVVISAVTSSGAASCVMTVDKADNIRFAYASPNSSPINSTVTFKAITDKEKTAVQFVVTNGSTSYTVNADKKQQDGDLYIWTGTKTLSKSGLWTITAYSKTSATDSFATTEDYGLGEVYVTPSDDKLTTVCAERRASDELIGLIADYEGFVSSVTGDSITGSPTLGYGKVVYSGEQFYNNLTKSEAYAYLCKTVNHGGYTTKVNKFLIENNLKFNQQQFDGLVCFAYNVGANVLYNDPDLQAVLLATKSGSSAIQAGDSGYVNDSSVNLRAGAGTNYAIITTMAKNTKFTFVDAKIYNNDWYKIKLSNGTEGYIYKSYASADKTSANQGDLNKVNKDSFAQKFFQYHHAGRTCYKGLLYRRIDEGEVFFYGDYIRDGQKNKNGFKFTCSINSGFTIG